MKKLAIFVAGVLLFAGVVQTTASTVDVAIIIDGPGPMSIQDLA